MFAWFTADSGTFDCQVQFSVKTSLSEFSGFCHQESGDDISIDFRSLSTPLRECSHQDAHTPVVLFCCVCVCFLFRVARAGRATFASNG